MPLPFAPPQPITPSRSALVGFTPIRLVRSGWFDSFRFPGDRLERLTPRRSTKVVSGGNYEPAVHVQAHMNKLASSIAAIAIAAGVTACGSSGATSTEAQDLSNITATTTPDTVPETVRATVPPAPKTMFDACGMNLQAAQDMVQDRLDIWYSDSFDATVDDRMQLMDRNWIVVTQVPADGDSVSDDEDIVFGVVKKSDGITPNC